MRKNLKLIVHSLYGQSSFGGICFIMYNNNSNNNKDVFEAIRQKEIEKKEKEEKMRREKELIAYNSAMQQAISDGLILASISCL